jgi:hypothetical protein
MKRKVFLIAGILFCVLLSDLSAQWSGFGVNIRFKNNAEVYWNFKGSNASRDASGKITATLSGSVKGSNGLWYHNRTGYFISMRSFNRQLETMEAVDKIEEIAAHNAEGPC